MISRRLNGPDPERSHLRSVVMAVEREVSHLKQVMPRESAVLTDGLIENWENLVALLALGPEPQYRPCPFCDNLGIRSATRCVSCWEKLPPFIP
jgi:hypothetical protein